MGQSFASLNYHIVFSTKHRERTLDDGLRPRLYEYVAGILRGQACELLAAGGEPDHVHWLVSLDKQIAVSEAVRLMKSNSSKWIHETFPGLGAFGWQSGYGAFSVSLSNLPRVRQYLHRQAEHHRRETFQEEFRKFLIRHSIDFDERFVWD